jgi:hypothetical protein
MGAAGGGGVGDAWVPLNSSLLSSDSTYVTFTSALAEEAWSEFQDLMLITYGRDKYTGQIGNLLCKANTGGTYRTADLSANGSTVVSQGYTDSGFRIAIVPRDSADAGEFGAGITYFNDINNTGKYTTALTISACDQNGAGSIIKTTTIWESTAVVTQLKMLSATEAADIASGSRFDLFGLRAF